MNRALALLSLSLPLSVGACNTVPQRYQLAAEPLMPVPGPEADNASKFTYSAKDKTNAKAYSGLANIDKVHVLVQDSQDKCTAFVSSMFAEAAGTGFVLDVLSTGTSALSTVFAPVSAKNALSAASTIFSGARTSITAEYLNSLTISHISQAIQSTYTADMTKYIAYLDGLNVPDTEIHPYAERTKIMSIHGECALAPAEASIGASLVPTAQSASAPIVISYTVPAAAPTPTSIALGLTQNINANSDLASAGVTATQTSGVITIKTTTNYKIEAAVMPSGGTTITYSAGPPITLTVGTPRQGDQITVTFTKQAATSTASPAPPAAPAPTPAAAAKTAAPVYGRKI
jgi:hypothetical protein